MNNYNSLAATISEALPPSSTYTMGLVDIDCSFTAFIKDKGFRKRSFMKNDTFALTGVRVRKGGGLIFQATFTNDHTTAVSMSEIEYVEFFVNHLQDHFAFDWTDELGLVDESIYDPVIPCILGEKNFNAFYQSFMGMSIEESLESLGLTKKTFNPAVNDDVVVENVRNDFQLLPNYGEW